MGRSSQARLPSVCVLVLALALAVAACGGQSAQDRAQSKVYQSALAPIKCD